MDIKKAAKKAFSFTLGGFLLLSTIAHMSKSDKSKQQAEDKVPVEKVQKTSKLKNILSGIKDVIKDARENPYNELAEQIEWEKRLSDEAWKREVERDNLKYGLDKYKKKEKVKIEKTEPVVTETPKEPVAEKKSESEVSSNAHRLSYPKNVPAYENNYLTKTDESSKEITNDEIMKEASDYITTGKTNLKDSEKDFENKKILEKYIRYYKDRITGNVIRVDIRHPDDFISAVRTLGGSLEDITHQDDNQNTLKRDIASYKVEEEKHNTEGKPLEDNNEKNVKSKRGPIIAIRKFFSSSH